MRLSHQIVVALWLVFITVWVIGAATAKRTVNRIRWRREVGIRLLIFALIYIAFRTPAIRHGLLRMQRDTGGDVVVVWVGVVLVAIGFGLAIAARLQLGRNWGMPASRKENPDLITSGPYRVIRHPIYTGILLAIIGSALSESILFLLALVFAAPYFFVAARSEERLMAEQFPDQYPAYMQRTKMLIPYVL